MKKAIIVSLLTIGAIGGGITAYSQMASKATTECCDNSHCCPEKPDCCLEGECE